MKNDKRESERLVKIFVIDDDCKRVAVPIHEFFIVDINDWAVAPLDNKLPIIYVYYSPTSIEIHAWMATEEHLNQIKEQICLEFNNFSGSFKRAYFETQKYGLIKEFVCKLFD